MLPLPTMPMCVHRCMPNKILEGFWEADRLPVAKTPPPRGVFGQPPGPQVKSLGIHRLWFAVKIPSLFVLQPVKPRVQTITRNKFFVIALFYKAAGGQD